MPELQWPVVILAYLLGSFPTAYLAGRWARVDLRTLGDGNLGSKNTFLNLGLRLGVIVGVVDVTKGALAIWCARWLGASEATTYLAGFAVVLGHDFPIFTRFRGGQGMAAALGVLAELQPLEAAIGVLIALGLLMISNNWDLSWGVGLGSMPVSGWAFGRPVKDIWFTVLLLPTIGLKSLVDKPMRRRLEANRRG